MFPTSFRVLPALLFVGVSLLGCSGNSPEKLLASAREYLAQDNPNAAVIQLKNVLQKNANSPEARYLLGRALLEVENPVAAMVELGKASDLKYPQDEVAPLMAKALLMQGQAKKLTDQYADTVLSSPAATADLKTSVAVAYMAQRDRPQTEAALKAAFQAVPDYPPALILNARLLASEGDTAAAASSLDKVFGKAPGDPDAWLLKGDLLRHEGDWSRAIDAYRKALASRKDSLPAHSAIISIYLSRNELKAAKDQLDALKKLRPNHPQTRYLEAQWALQSGDIKTANDITQQLLKYGSDNPLLLQLAGAVALRKGSLIEAEQLLAKAIQAAPGLSLARRLLVQTYSRSGKPAMALETLEPLLDVKEPDAATLSMAATVYLQSGDAKRAEELFNRAVKLNPDDADSRTALALMHLYRDKSDTAFGELESIAGSTSGASADLALVSANVQRKDFVSALAAIDRLEKKQPNKALAPNLRGRVQIMKGDFAAARRSFEQALSRDALNFAAIESLAALDLKDKKPELAEQRFDKLLAAQPENARALMAKAQLQARSGKGTEEVAGTLNKAVKASPDDAAPRLLLINYYMQQRDFKQALSAAQQGASALPNSLQLLEALGRAQAATGDFNQAITSFNKLVSARPKAPQVYVVLADVYVAAGKRDEALRSLKDALQIAPDFLPAQQKLLALQLEAGHTSEALAIARKVQEQRPKEAIGWVFEGDIQSAAKKWAAACALYRTALQKGPATGIAEKLHASLIAGGKAADADTQATEWTKDHPEDAAFILYLGSRALAEARIDEAHARFQQLQKMQPDNPIVLNNLAWTSAKLGKPGALEFAERANKLSPGQPAFMDTLAMVLAEGKETQRAIEIEQKALALQPQNALYRLSLARMYVTVGDKALARQELDHLAQLGSKFPHQDEVQKLRSQL